MKLVAALIVKNEAHVIGRCLNSLAPHADAAIISDTGSTDNTRNIVQKRGCDLIENPWEDFATNRNHVLRAAEQMADRLGIKHVLCGIDADEELVVPEDFQWPELTADAYDIMCHYGDLRYRRRAIVRTWSHRWHGVIHEALVPVHPSEPLRVANLDGIYIQVHSDGARAKDPNTAWNDLEVLKKAVEAEPDNARYRFYLAQTYKDIRNLTAAMDHYEARANMTGWQPERAYARHMVGCCHDWLGENPCVDYALAFSMDPTRAEPLVALARYYRSHGCPHMAAIIAMEAMAIPRPPDGLFVENDVYEWRALDEFVMSAYYTRLRLAGKQAAEVLLKRKFPATERERIEKNALFYKDL